MAGARSGVNIQLLQEEPQALYHRILQLHPPFVHANIGQNRGEDLFAG